MAKIIGHEVAVKALKEEGVDTGFYIFGGPMSGMAASLEKYGMRAIDTRHEQAAAMAAHAYARTSGKPAVVFAASGPGVTNLVTGVAVAQSDRAPMIVFGGASAYGESNTDAFQEMDTITMMKPFTKWADRVAHVERIPMMVSKAFRHALTGSPSPVYLDFPADIVNGYAEEQDIEYPTNYRPKSRPHGDPESISRAVEVLAKAERPVIVTGNGIMWSEAHSELQDFVHQTGIPFFTTPLGRGVIPEDDPLCFLAARSVAFRSADVALVIGTRPNYVIGSLKAPRWAPELKVIMANIEPTDIGLNRGVDVDIIGDAKMVLQQLAIEADGKIDPSSFGLWVEELQKQDASRRERQEIMENSDTAPIHPLRLCKEIRDIMPRDAILAVDGHETLNYARQSIPSFLPRKRLNSTHSGCMGVGMPFALGAKVAKPDSMVICLHGDGSFGMNGMELDTAVRHNLPILTVILNNGGWTAKHSGTEAVPGRDLGFTRYEQMFAPLGLHSEYVEEPGDIRPALLRAVEAVEGGQSAIVNVICDETARSETVKFSTGGGGAA